MEHDRSYSRDSHNSHEEHGQGDSEPIIVKMMTPSEKLASELNLHGVVTEALTLGSHPLESKPYYSHKFALTSKLITNRGIMRVTGKNFDLIQVLQRN